MAHGISAPDSEQKSRFNFLMTLSYADDLLCPTGNLMPRGFVIIGSINDISPGDVVRYAGRQGTVVQLFPAGVVLIRLVDGDNIVTSCEMLEPDSKLHADGDDTVAVDDDDA